MDVELAQAISLLQIGVPWETAFRLNEAEALAVMVLAGEARGQTFDWQRLRWEEPPPKG